MTLVYVLLLIGAVALGISGLSNGYSPWPWVSGGISLLVLCGIVWVIHVGISTAH